VGFDWGRIDDVIKKIHEELEEVQSAPDESTRRAEVGDLLFTVVNYARWLEVDPEAALRSANQRFRKRFWELEKHASSMNRKLSDMTLEEMDSIWEDIKRDEGNTLAQ
jgi:uncharacterized protein YabN with tetrapyrrole methylase and pyrophosphatase domain